MADVFFAVIMNELLLFTDGSVNPKSKVGYGAYLIAAEHGMPIDALRTQVKVRRFDNTSSAKLELQTLLWALGNIQPGSKVVVHTDSQTIMGLPDRRERLEQNAYRSKKNRLLNNYELYQEFFRVTDTLVCKFVKVRGHQATKHKDEIHRLFTLVDKASRKALRKDNE